MSVFWNNTRCRGAEGMDVSPFLLPRHQQLPPSISVCDFISEKAIPRSKRFMRLLMPPLRPTPSMLTVALREREASVHRSKGNLPRMRQRIQNVDTARGRTMVFCEPSKYEYWQQFVIFLYRKNITEPQTIWKPLQTERSTSPKNY